MSDIREGFDQQLIGLSPLGRERSPVAPISLSGCGPTRRLPRHEWVAHGQLVGRVERLLDQAAQ